MKLSIQLYAYMHLRDCENHKYCMTICTMETRVKKQQKRKDPANHIAFPKLPSPCLVARAGRKHLPVVTQKSQTRASVIKVPTFGPRKSVRSTGPVGGVLGALVVNLTCEVRRVAMLPSEPRGDAYQIRQAKYVDSSHSVSYTHLTLPTTPYV